MNGQDDPVNREWHSAELWVDGSSVLRNGVALDYKALAAAIAGCSGGRYYDHVLPASGKGEDRELRDWQAEEQQRAEAAGFALRLSPSWSERLRCRFCSCLNAVQYPAPCLLDLQGDLLALERPPVCLLSHNPGLLFSLCKTRGNRAAPLGQDVRLLALGDNLRLLDWGAWPPEQQEIFQVASEQALELSVEDVEWES
ncbi:MAG: hypothetical protein AAF975_03105 [Spirochaetota bacterium]